jgi:hypothetical protein
MIIVISARNLHELLIVTVELCQFLTRGLYFYWLLRSELFSARTYKSFDQFQMFVGYRSNLFDDQLQVDSVGHTLICDRQVGVSRYFKTYLIYFRWNLIFNFET